MPKLKLGFLPITFPANLLVVALPIIPNIGYNFKVILYLTIFVFLSQGSCFKSEICIQKSLESAPIMNKSRQCSVPWFRVTVMDLAFRVLFSLTPNNIGLDKV